MLYPPSADLAVPDEPEIPLEALENQEAYDGWVADMTIWGRGLQRQVGRLCRYFAERGMEIECPQQ